MLTWLSLPLRRLLLLFISGLAGVFAVLPHLRSHLGEFLADAVLIGVAASAGTYLVPRTALQSPILDAALTGRPFPRRSLAPAARALGVGVVTTLVLIALDATLFAPRLAAAQLTAAAAAPPLWTGVLYALAGGISEEVVFHYGLLAALAWVAQRLMPGAVSYWFAIAVSALALGLSHLPSAAALLPLTPLVATRTLVLTGIGGVATGWLYWCRGLEAAMLAHGVVSFALHVAAPGVFG